MSRCQADLAAAVPNVFYRMRPGAWRN